MAVLAVVNCGNDDDDDVGAAAPGVDAGTGVDVPAVGAEAGEGGGGGTPDASAPNPRLDLLFVVDNSYLMDEKYVRLADSVGALLRSVKATDIHVGMVTSSFRLRNLCPFEFQDDKGRLINRQLITIDGGVVPGSEAGFLSFGPGGSTGDIESLVKRTTELIRGARYDGCGIEAQLEALYRFAFDPDPPLEVSIDTTTNLPVVNGVDYELLAQRKAFFRPDSTVAFVVLSDEDDASIDLFSAGGFGHSYFATAFPHSKVPLSQIPAGFAAARGTSVCATNPASPDCTSCAFGLTCDPSTADCQRIRNDSACTTSPIVGQSGPGYDGFFDPKLDSYNLRAFDMKRRFGVEARFPISRYIAALTGKRLPNRVSAHPESTPSGVRTIAPYVQAESCANPLMSDDLPSKSGDELCELRDGPRTERQILYGFMGGTLPGAPGSVSKWEALLGRNPEQNDLSGIDPHMLPSIEPRAGLGGADLPAGNNGSDPIHGREWRTQSADLQYACTYATGASVNCAEPTTPCDCPRDGTSLKNPPLCEGPNGVTQTRSKAFPGVRELQVAKALGERAIVASVCGGSVEYKAFHEAMATRIDSVAAP